MWTGRAHACIDEVTRIWASDVVREQGFAPSLRVIGLGVVQLEATQQAIGGQRYWFRCPRCHQRRAWLAAAGDVGTCRTCSNIVYRSQCLSDFNRRTRRAEQIYDLINVEYAPLSRTQGKKPYGMRWRTYWRLFDQAQAIDPWSARIEKRYRHGRGLKVKPPRAAAVC